MILGTQSNQHIKFRMLLRKQSLIDVVSVRPENFNIGWYSNQIVIDMHLEQFSQPDPPSRDIDCMNISCSHDKTCLYGFKI